MKHTKIAMSVLLPVLSLMFAVVAEQTTHYPPSYLLWSGLWASMAAASAFGCALLLVARPRLLVTTVGAVAVTTAATRGIAIMGEVVTSDFPTDETKASFIIAGVLWLTFALLLHDLFWRTVIPWAAGSRSGDGRRR